MYLRPFLALALIALLHAGEPIPSAHAAAGASTGSAAGAGTANATAAGDVSPRRPPAVRAASIDACARLLEAQGSGWCELGESISTVWPQREDVRGWTGPRSILIAWNGMAVDRDRRLLYFPASGGHADYLGNEVYEFDLNTGAWSRLTEPCPLALTLREGDEPPYGTFGFNKNSDSIAIPDPACGPASAHTYDGVQFASKTGTIFWQSGIYGANGGNFQSRGELWEFNPSRDERRNGLAPLAWTMHDLRVTHWPTSFELPDGRIVLGVNATDGTVFDPVAPDKTRAEWNDAGNRYGDGTALYDAQRRGAWFVTARHGLLWIPDSGAREEVTGRKTWPGHGIGAALRDGKLVTWNGRDTVTEFDPETKQHKLFDWRGKKPPTRDKRVYSKWVYLDAMDLFVGISDEHSGVLVYKHSSEPDASPPAVDAQALIDAARPGDEVTIPAGLYNKGVWVRKPLTVKFAKGVDFLEPVGGKGIVAVENARGPVIIDGLRIDRPPNCGSNCAGVRISGADYDVQIRNSRILNQEMGVLTDNRGGRLVIEDSEIGESGGGSALGHVIYAGYSDSLTIRRSVIRSSHKLGHLVKARAARILIEDSRILGENARHSRLVEAPCGAEVVIRDSVLQQSDQTDNAEMMLIGGVADPQRQCAGHPVRASTLTLDGVQVISNRDFSDDEPARSAGRTGVMKWRAPNGHETAVTIERTTFENVHHLIFAESDRPEVPLP